MTPFPLKNDLVLDALRISRTGVVITVYHSDGSSTPYTYNNVTDATAAINIVYQLQFDASTPILTSLSPNPFDFTTTSAAPVTITGYNFVANHTYTLYLENAGVIDNNGWNMSCTFSSPTTLLAVFGSFGDNIMDVLPVAIYLYDVTATKYSNAIYGSFNNTTISY